MPSLACFGYALDDPAILEHEVMRRYFVLARSIAVGQSAQCLVRAHHAGVVQNEHRGPVDIAAAPVIRGGSYRRNKGGIRSEHRHAGTLSEIACPSEHWFGFVSFRLCWQGSASGKAEVLRGGGLAAGRPALECSGITTRAAGPAPAQGRTCD